MELYRKPTAREQNLLELLVKRSSMSLPIDWKDNLLVRPMEDGGMGSLSLCTTTATKTGRLFGERVSEFQFTDDDGVEVIASLNTDTSGELFELDIWKTDFTPLISLPYLS